MRKLKRTKRIIMMMMVGISILILLGGCSKYDCIEGTKEGDSCYTDTETKNLYGTKTIYPYDEHHLDDLVIVGGYDNQEWMHTTGNQCLYENVVFVNLTHFEINDTTIKIEEFGNDLRLDNNEEKTKTYWFNITFTYRWKRYIWDECDTYCARQVEEYGGEVKKKIWC